MQPARRRCFACLRYPGLLVAAGHQVNSTMPKVEEAILFNGEQDPERMREKGEEGKSEKELQQPQGSSTSPALHIDWKKKKPDSMPKPEKKQRSWFGDGGGDRDGGDGGGGWGGGCGGD